ncbi:MAG TPA: ABC transporter substrate-binding protein [Gemmatimonadaceae bacterium]|nr:ABC transporter substrate-binding protein [Gemmatimonadaceae bacterium]
MPAHTFSSSHRILIRTLAGAILGGGIMLGCHSGSEPITLGAAGPWQEAFGAMAQRGLNLGIDQINAAGGINGRPLNVIEKDDSGQGATAAAIAGKFVQNPKILAVVGHVNSGAMVAAAKVYDGQLPAVATSVTTPDLTGISPWVFRVISSDSVNGVDLAHFAASLGEKRVSILYEDDSYGRGLAQSFQRSFAGTVISIDPIATDSQNFEPYVSYFKKRQPDMVFVASTDGAGIPFLRQARRQKLDADFLGGDGWTGIVVDTLDSEGAYVGAPFSAQDPRPEAQRFVKAFEAKYNGMVPDGNAALEYDALMLVKQAIESGATTRKAIRDYLASLTEQTAYHGVTGTIRFLPTGDPVGKGFVMTRVHQGALLVQGR